MQPIDPAVIAASTVVDLDNVRLNPAGYTWSDFRPNVKKLILAGAAETEHIAVLWYTVTDGAVGLHYHSKTESVYVVDGTQTDAKGVYPTGTVYFNPPGSGHEIMKSSGFFLLSYASPPDFMKTDLIGPYMPVRIETGAAELTTQLAFAPKGTGVRTYAPPLETTGGLKAELIEITAAVDYEFKGNYLLVLKGSCQIQGTRYGKDILVVTRGVVPLTYQIAAPPASSCLAMGVSF
jgi:hypothetical protein